MEKLGVKSTLEKKQRKGRALKNSRLSPIWGRQKRKRKSTLIERKTGEERRGNRKEEEGKSSRKT